MSMKSFLVLTAIRGLCRVDGGKKRPIEPGAVVGLPDAIAEGLLHLDAIEVTDAEPTVELVFLDDDGAARALAADLRQRDHDTLIAAVAEIGGVLIFPDDQPEKLGEPLGVALIAADDRAGLVAAIGKLGGDVVFFGDPVQRFAGRLTSIDLLAELATRARTGQLPTAEVAEVFAGLQGKDHAGDDDAPKLFAPADPSDTPPRVIPSVADQAEPAKPVAKPKARAKSHVTAAK